VCVGEEREEGEEVCRVQRRESAFGGAVR